MKKNREMELKLQGKFPNFFFLNPSLTEFVYPGYWHFEKGLEVWKFHDILLGHGGTMDLGTELDKKAKI